MGPRFEQICRDRAQDYAPADLFAAPVAHVGHGVVNGAETAKLLCFSAAEPPPHLRAAADAGAATIVGLNELYAAP